MTYHLSSAAGVASLFFNQWKSGKELEAIQLRKLRHTINNAYKRVPHYREIFGKSNLVPDDIKSISDLGKLPILTKSDIAKNPQSKFIVGGLELQKCTYSRTTGSTGMPLSFLQDSSSKAYSTALMEFSFMAMGIMPHHKIARLYNIPEKKKPGILQKMGLFRRKTIPISMSVGKVLEEVRSYAPDALYSYPSFLNIFAKKSMESGFSGSARFIVAHGETLLPSARKTVEKAFGVAPFETYGSAEFNRLAFECASHSGLHCISDAAIIEIVRNGENVGEGEKGELVITGLYNDAMPLIRYNIGDVSSFSPESCACGRGYRLLNCIEGRSDDFIVLPSGTVISPRNVNVLDDLEGIAEYRIVQEKRNLIVVDYVGDGAGPVLEKEIAGRVEAGCMNEPVEINVRKVEILPRGNSGKLRTVVSKVGAENG